MGKQTVNGDGKMEKVYWSDWRAKGWEIEGKDEYLYTALTSTLNAYEQAIAKHPDDTWPKDVIHQAAIMAEEAGEAIQAANDVVHQGASLEPLRKELAQTAATCLRCLVNLEDRA